MRRNGESAALVDEVANLAGRFSFQVGQFCPDAKQMAIGGRDLDAGENEKVIDRLTVETHQTFLEQIVDRIACIVIGDGEPMQTFGPGRRDQILRAGNPVARKKRVRMEIDVQWHLIETNWQLARWKVPASLGDAFLRHTLMRCRPFSSLATN